MLYIVLAFTQAMRRSMVGAVIWGSHRRTTVQSARTAWRYFSESAMNPAARIVSPPTREVDAALDFQEQAGREWAKSARHLRSPWNLNSRSGVALHVRSRIE